MATSSRSWVRLALLCLAPFWSMALRAADPMKAAPNASAKAEKSIDRSIELAIGYLKTESESWLKSRKCATCHHAPMALWALGEAARQGYAIDKKYTAELLETMIGSNEKMIAAKMINGPGDTPDPRPSGQGLNIGLPFMAVGARSAGVVSAGQKQSLKFIADEIVKKQKPDGSWDFFANLRRPPINEFQTTDAVWILMALQDAPAEELTDAHRTALKKGLAWLEKAKLSDSQQDQVFHLLMELRTGKPRKELEPLIVSLFARQHPNGGWGQLPGLPADAFATGQTLYVLSYAGFTAKKPELKPAIDFLISTQKPDGSWPMTSRSTPNGEPGGSKNLTPITCAASSWATLGLSRLFPKPNQAQ